MSRPPEVPASSRANGIIDLYKGRLAIDFLGRYGRAELFQLSYFPEAGDAVHIELSRNELSAFIEVLSVVSSANRQLHVVLDYDR